MSEADKAAMRADRINRQTANDEVRRIRDLRAGVRRHMQVLAVWCGSGRCSVARVYQTSGGLLLDVSSPESRSPISDNGFMTNTGRGEWLTGPGAPTWGRWATSTSAVCRCSNTSPIRLDFDRLRDAALDSDTQNVAADLVAAT